MRGKRERKESGRRAEGERFEEGRVGGLDGATVRIGRKKRGTTRLRLSNVASGEEIGKGRVREEEGAEERFEQEKEGKEWRV